MHLALGLLRIDVTIKERGLSLPQFGRIGIAVKVKPADHSDPILCQLQIISNISCVLAFPQKQIQETFTAVNVFD